jgi:hypothetical protein
VVTEYGSSEDARVASQEEQSIRRVQTMLAELDAANAEYARARDEFEAVRVKFESAKERFAAVRRLAGAALSEHEMSRWQYSHSSTQYVGVKIGDAIGKILVAKAFASAEQHFESNRRRSFFPAMNTDQILEALERGGYEFRTPTPKREVHAALINLDGVKKKGNWYVTNQAQDILSMMAPAEEPEPDPESYDPDSYDPDVYDEMQPDPAEMREDDEVSF